MPRTRLLFVIPSLAFGGAERQLVELLRLLSQGQYHSTVVYLTGYRFPGASGFYAEVSRLPNVDLVAVDRRGKYDLISPIRRLAGLIRERDIDIVCGRLNFGGMLGLVAGRLTGRPVIADSIRDCATDRTPILWTCRRLQARFADYVVSNSTAGFLVRFGGMRHNFRVIHNVVDPTRFTATETEKAALRKQLGLNRFRVIVGMIASMTTFKDHDAFLEVARIASESVPDAGFVMLGDGPRRAFLEERARQLGLDDRVLFLGARADADAVMQLIDISVLLTNFRIIQEGLSNAVLEAMACGKPVIATWGGGTPEAIENEVTGFLVRDNDVAETAAVLVRLLREPELRRSVGKRARQVVLSRFTPAAVCDSYKKLFVSLQEKMASSSCSLPSRDRRAIARRAP